ncbi:MAG: hypothetical protein FWD72_01920 [Eggerthellaceae bacterium]|nr:hypothetical protein [Eggerthellaceae bacterium]
MKPRYVMPLEEVPGFCPECETLNGPTAKVCKACGAPLPKREAKIFGQAAS